MVNHNGQIGIYELISRWHLFRGQPAFSNAGISIAKALDAILAQSVQDFTSCGVLEDVIRTGDASKDGVITTRLVRMVTAR